MLAESLSLSTCPLSHILAAKASAGAPGGAPGHLRVRRPVRSFHPVAEGGYRAIRTFPRWELRDPVGRRVGRLRDFVDREGRVLTLGGEG